MIPAQLVDLAKKIASVQTDDESQINSDQPALDEIQLDIIEQLLEESNEINQVNPHLGRGLAAIAWMAAQTKHDHPYLRGRAALLYGQSLNRAEFPDSALRVLEIARSVWIKLDDSNQVNRCDWQIGVANRILNRYPDAVELLTKTADEMQSAGMLDDAAYCRRDLGTTLNLQGRADLSGEPIRKALELFSNDENEIEIARCRLPEAARLQWLGRYDDASAELSLAIPALEKADLFVEQGMAYYIYAFLNMQRGTLAESIDHLNKARDLFNKVGLAFQIARCDNILGSAYLRSIRPLDAIPPLERAARWFHDHNRPVQAAYCDANLGLSYELLGDYNLARKKTESVIPTFQAAGEIQSAANNQYQLGIILCKAGHLEESLSCLETAWRTWQSINRPLYAASCALYLSNTYKLLGREDERLNWLESAIEGYKTTDSPVGVARTQIEMSHHYILAGQPSRALEFARQARKTLDGNTADMAFCERRLGEISLALDDTKTAIEHFACSVDAFTEIGMQVCALESQIALGETQSSIDQAQGRSTLESSLSQASEWQLPELAWRASISLAKIDRDQDNPVAELNHTEEAAYWLSLARRRLTQTSLEKDYLAGKIEVLERGFDLALELDRPEIALFFNDETRSQTLAVQFIYQNLKQPDSFTDSLVLKRNHLLTQIQNLENELRTIVFAQRTSILSSHQSTLMKRHHEAALEYESISAQIERSGRASTGRSTDIKPLDPEAFIKKGWQCLAYHLSKNLVTLFITTPNGIMSRQRPISQFDHKALEMCCSTSLQKRGLVFGQPGSALNNPILSQQWRKQLYKILIPPEIDDLISPDSTLTIAPHGMLYNLPFHTLIDEQNKFLIEKTALSYAPSLSLLQTCAKRPIQKRIKNCALIIGVQSFEGRHQDLQHATEEAIAVAGMVSYPYKLLVDKDANVENLSSLSGNYRIIHIATHGFTNREYGRLAGIALSDQDLLLDALNDIRLSAPVVVLSACETGIGLGQIDNQSGGVAGVFFTLGARVVVATLWPTFDPVTASIMQDFYQGLENGDSVSLALARAQRKRIDSPLFYWAPLSCFGLPNQGVSLKQK
ncbi:MAG: CHAT domain-containing protein [Anaerolineales bacterium]|nr:CHAT domain-containing protein [Anaerolineales bacterium]